VLVSHLGTRPLTSWQLMADLGRLSTQEGGRRS
jgi:hypothetical protein